VDVYGLRSVQGGQLLWDVTIVDVYGFYDLSSVVSCGCIWITICPVWPVTSLHN
jgi:hypothetical protein